MNAAPAVTVGTKSLDLSRQGLLTKPAATVLATVYAAFVVLFPWELIQKLPFSDFIAYVEEFSNQVLSKRELYQLSGLKDFYTFEVLWDELARSLTRLTGSAAVALHLISFFILFVWALFLFRRVHFGVALLFLFNPTAIDLSMSIIRNGLAWSLVIIGMNVRSKFLKYALFFVAIFIHSSTLLLLVIFGLVHLAARIWKGRSLTIAGLGIGVGIGLAVTIGAQIAFGIIGDRRFSAGYALGGGSLLQASLWLILLYFMCISGREYVRENILVIALLAWYETMNPFIPWSYRIWGTFLPVIAVAILKLPVRKRQIAMYCYTGYFVLQWIYWTKLLDYWTLT